MGSCDRELWEIFFRLEFPEAAVKYSVRAVALSRILHSELTEIGEPIKLRTGLFISLSVPPHTIFTADRTEDRSYGLVAE